ncbi:MAG: hypothetical protein MRY64_03520, partial [Hyphomonadaceae bacterium]|nr:hypothetical protein [Hyphomonadaceae bacterium]
TAWHETGSVMLPVRETFARTDAAAVRNLERKGAAYAHRHPNGHAYYGRGYVQLTWKANYLKMGKRLGFDADGTNDLVDEPDLVMTPEIGARILCIGMVEGSFSKDGKGLGHYLGAGKTDWRNARRTVNGLDKADVIAQYAQDFWACIQDSLVAQEPVPEPQPTEVSEPQAPFPSPTEPAPRSEPTPDITDTSSDIPAHDPRLPGPMPGSQTSTGSSQKPLSQSRTIWGSIFAAFAGMIMFIEDVIESALELTPDIPTPFGPVDSIWLVAIVMLAAIILIIYARIDDRSKLGR